MAGSVALAELVADSVSAGLLLTTVAHEPVWHNRSLLNLVGTDPTVLPLADCTPDGPAVQAEVGSRWLELSCRPVDGRLLYEVTDVTALRAERAAAQGDGWRLAQIERIAKVGSWEWDLRTNELVWSEALRRTFGVADGTRLDFAFFATLMHPDDAPMLEALLRRAIADRRPLSYTLRLRQADGSEMRTYECYAEVYTDAKGRVVRLLGTAHDITEMRRVQDELAYLAGHDALTGLVNRRSFTARLADELAAGGVGALLLLDVDNFKDINDLRGHAVGDQVMRCLSRRLREHLPAGAVLARLGGDEFAALLPGSDAAGASEVADGLCRAAAETPLIVGGEPLRVTVSVGLAALDGEDDCEVLLAHADIALYEAKNAGRNRSRLFAPEQYRHAVHRVNILSRFRAALDGGLLSLDAQPIVFLADGTVSSYELLVRLRDGLYPEVGPADILPALERGDLVLELDRWVVGEAVSALSRTRDLRFDVNLSTRSIDDPGFGDWVVDALDRAGIDPTRLGVEITETAAISNLDAARRLARALTGAGCRFSLDDFGAGFGSFAYLKHLPFTTVKIAGEFVRQVDDDRVDRVLVDAVVRAARGLGMTTVAEYVDRPPLVEALRELGVDLGQGYHLGRPGRLATLLTAHRTEPHATIAFPRP